MFLDILCNEALTYSKVPHVTSVNRVPLLMDITTRTLHLPRPRQICIKPEEAPFCQILDYLFEYVLGPRVYLFFSNGKGNKINVLKLINDLG
jgi:hypothetical protein